MIYSEISPAAALARWVECFWILRGATDRNAAPERILPDGCVELILNFADPFCEVRACGKRRRQPQLFAVGQMERALWIAPTGRVDIIGVRFHPWGARPFLNVPMGELTGRVEDLGGVSSHIEQQVRQRVSPLESTAGRIAALEEVLLDAIGKAGDMDSRVQHTAATIVSQRGLVSVSELAAQAGVSARQIERQFDAWVGISPKQLCALLRFQQVFRAMEQANGSNWAGVAVECGYYDQPHLIRDFRRYADATPARLGELQTLTEVFLRKNRVSHFSKKPAPLVA